MSFLSNLFGLQKSADAGTTRDASDDFWFGGLSSPAAAGVAVTVDNAMLIPVVSDCCKVLSESVSTLPFAVFEKDEEGNKKKVKLHPVNLMLSDPNPETTSVEFIGQLVWDLVTNGNSYNLVKLGVGTLFESVRRLDYKYMTVERLSDGGVRYRYREPGQSEKTYGTDKIWHIKNFPINEDGLTGRSTIETGREVISAGLALQNYANTFFKNDATPPFVITNPNNFKDDESRGNFLTAITRWWGGARRHKPALLEYGMGIEKIGNSNEESQFLETRKENALDIARLWHMPPHKVGILDRATFSNIEQQSLDFVVDVLLPLLRLIEASVRKYLIIRDDKYFFEFNVAGLLRGDLKTRYEAYAIGRNWGWLSVNEIRRLENLNGIGVEGDARLQPLNMQEAGAPPLHNNPKAENLIKVNGKVNGTAVDHGSLAN